MKCVLWCTTETYVPLIAFISFVESVTGCILRKFADHSINGVFCNGCFDTDTNTMRILSVQLLKTCVFVAVSYMVDI